MTSLPCAGQTLLESFCQHLAASWKGTPDSLAVYRRVAKGLISRGVATAEAVEAALAHEKGVHEGVLLRHMKAYFSNEPYRGKRSISLSPAGQALFESFCQHLKESWTAKPESLATYKSMAKSLIAGGITTMEAVEATLREEKDKNRRPVLLRMQAFFDHHHQQQQQQQEEGQGLLGAGPARSGTRPAEGPGPDQARAGKRPRKDGGGGDRVEGAALAMAPAGWRKHDEQQHPALFQATAPAAAALVAVHRLCVFLQPERAQPSGFFFTCQHYGPHSPPEGQLLLVLVVEDGVGFTSSPSAQQHLLHTLHHHFAHAQPSQPVPPPPRLPVVLQPLSEQDCHRQLAGWASFFSSWLLACRSAMPSAPLPSRPHGMPSALPAPPAMVPPGPAALRAGLWPSWASEPGARQLVASNSLQRLVSRSTDDPRWEAQEPLHIWPPPQVGRTVLEHEWAFFVVRTEPAWPLPLEEQGGGGVELKLRVSYEGAITLQDVLWRDVFVAVATQPVSGEQEVQDFVGQLTGGGPDGLAAKAADLLARRPQGCLPLPDRFPIVVAGDRRAPGPLIARLLELLARTLGVQDQGSSSMAAKPEGVPVIISRSTASEERPYQLAFSSITQGPYGLAVLGDSDAGLLFALDSVVSRPGTGQLLPIGNVDEDVVAAMEAALAFWRLHADYLIDRYGGDAGDPGAIVDPRSTDVDFRLHVRDSTVRSTGGSCGLVIAVHLATLFLGVSTNSEVAVTGSVSLSGRVDPVSGMGPKISAAHQYGLKYVALPAGNVHDGRVVDIEPGRVGSVHLLEQNPRLPVRLSPAVCSGTTLYAVETVFDCLDLALYTNNTVEGEGQPPRPADLRTVNVMSWCPFAGALFHMEVALFQEQQQQSQVQPATMPRFKYTGRIQEGARVGIETACLALARLVEERGGWALPARFSLPLTSHILHFHMTGSQAHHAGYYALGAVVCVVALMLGRPVPEHEAFLGEVDLQGKLSLNMKCDTLLLEVARREGLHTLHLPVSASNRYYRPEQVSEEERRGVVLEPSRALHEVIDKLWPGALRQQQQQGHEEQKDVVSDGGREGASTLAASAGASSSAGEGIT